MLRVFITTSMKYLIIHVPIFGYTDDFEIPTSFKSACNSNNFLCKHEYIDDRACGRCLRNCSSVFHSTGSCMLLILAALPLKAEVCMLIPCTWMGASDLSDQKGTAKWLTMIHMIDSLFASFLLIGSCHSLEKSKLPKKEMP